MPAWNDILTEIQNTQRMTPNGITMNYDGIMNKYIQIFAEYRKRNVIVYYSDWLTPGKSLNIDINDGDMVGFMNAVNGLDKSKGLDLIIHTPGGNPTATESIVNYLHSIFGNNIEVFVPHMAMSAGTMLACSAKTIWMGKQSSLGPIDPQFNGIAAYNIKKEFEDAKKDLESNPNSFRNWQIILSKYNPAFYYTVLDAIELSSRLVKKWLEDYMFEGDDDAKVKAKRITERLNVNTGSHSKHFSLKECIDLGLNIKSFESDSSIQDMVLSIYHCLQICGNGTNVNKIVANSIGKNYFVSNSMR